jgi:hypothetical protein
MSEAARSVAGPLAAFIRTRNRTRGWLVTGGVGAAHGLEVALKVLVKIAKGWRRSLPSTTAIRVKPANFMLRGAKVRERSANALSMIPSCFFSGAQIVWKNIRGPLELSSPVFASLVSI